MPEKHRKFTFLSAPLKNVCSVYHHTRSINFLTLLTENSMPGHYISNSLVAFFTQGMISHGEHHLYSVAIFSHF